MSGTLPEYLDLTRASHPPIRLAGHLHLAALPRLAAAVVDTGGQAAVELQVVHDGSQVGVRGSVQASLVLTCQRCFGNLDFPVTADINLVWVRTEEEAARLPELQEPLLSAGGRVKTADIIEDELLLTLPMAARHISLRDCGHRLRGDVQPQEEFAESAPAKPFAALKALKRH